MENLDPRRDLQVTQFLRTDTGGSRLIGLVTIPKTIAGEEESRAVLLAQQGAWGEHDVALEEVRHWMDHVEQLKLVFVEGANGQYRYQYMRGVKVEMDVTVIWPTNDAEVSMFKGEAPVAVRETAAMYREVTVPWIRTFPPERTAWIRALLAGDVTVLPQAGQILTRKDDPDSGWVIVPDKKWKKRPATKTLYVQIVFENSSLLSVRDLRAKHVPMLMEAHATAMDVIREKYGLEANRLRAYFHYPPSFWHLHMHVASLERKDASVDRCLLFHDVIERLTGLGGDEYYANATLTSVLTETHPLYKSFLSANAVN